MKTEYIHFVYGASHYMILKEEHWVNSVSTMVKSNKILVRVHLAMADRMLDLHEHDEHINDIMYVS